MKIPRTVQAVGATAVIMALSVFAGHILFGVILVGDDAMQDGMYMTLVVEMIILIVFGILMWILATKEG